MTRIDDRSVDERIPITLLTGFLGAGKTTLVNRLLSAPDAGKIAVIVNEFGEIGIDGDLIARANEDMLELTNGCICCAAQGDLMDGLNRLFLRKVGLAEPQVDFDKIVIETTGIADPSPLARLFYTDMKLDLTFRLDAVLTVVDLKHVIGQIARSPEAEKQIAIADKLIFNKRDLVDDAQFADAVAAVERLNPFSVKEVTTHGALPIDRLLDLDLFEPKRRDDMVGAWIGADQPALRQWRGWRSCPRRSCPYAGRRRRLPAEPRAAGVECAAPLLPRSGAGEGREPLPGEGHGAFPECREAGHIPGRAGHLQPADLCGIVAARRSRDPDRGDRPRPRCGGDAGALRGLHSQAGNRARPRPRRHLNIHLNRSPR